MSDLMPPLDSAVLQEIARIMKDRADGFARDLCDQSPDVFAGSEEAWFECRGAMAGRVSEAACKLMLIEILSAYTKSLLTMFDGGTALADQGVYLRIVDDKGQTLSRGIGTYLRDVLGLD